MRAGRLLAILMTLQARGSATAPALASECGVSVRTIYRDIDTLSSLGIPVYAERGIKGGYRLLDGYQTRLNGLSLQEARTLFLAGLPGPAHDMGLGPASAAAELKLLAALPATLRVNARQARTRFYLDAPGWFAEAEHPTHLASVTEAVWSQRTIRMRYQSWKSEGERCVEPLGVVLKGGTWYLVAQQDGKPKTYRVARIRDLEVLQQRFELPPSFDLAAYWLRSVERLEANLHPIQAELNVSPQGLQRLQALASSYVRSNMKVEPLTDCRGWYSVTMPVGATREACLDLLRLGVDAEVMRPPTLRSEVANIAAGLGSLYSSEP